MKRLIPLFLIPLFACSHEHPLTDHTHEQPDHTHEHDVPHHDHLNPLGLPFPYITRVYPPLDVPGFPPFGTLKKSPYDRVYIYFSEYPENLTLTKIDYGVYETSDVGLGIDFAGKYTARVSVDAYCSDPEHTGYIGFQLDWDSGTARFFYKCPEEYE